MVVEVMAEKCFPLTYFLPQGIAGVCPAYLPRRERKYQRLWGSPLSLSLTTAVLPSTSQFINSLTCLFTEILWAGFYRKGKAGGKKEGNWLKEMYRQTSFCCNLLYCVSQMLCFFTNWRFVATVHQASLSASFSQRHLLTSCFFVSFW